MPSVLYSTNCFIKTDLYRLRIYIDDQNENISSPIKDSLDFTSIDIPIHHIKPVLTRLNFQLLNEKKTSNNNNIPETIILNHILNIKQTISIPKKYNKSFSDSLPLPSSDLSSSSTHSQQTSQTTLINDSFQHRQFSFRRFFSLSTNSNNNNNMVLLPKTLIKINYVDVSNSIRWNIKTLEIEMDTEEIANELYSNLELCLSTLKQRPKRLLAFVNPLSGKGILIYSLRVNNIYSPFHLQRYGCFDNRTIKEF